ncbi:ABC-type transport system, permease component [Bdellovibrio bacteriovorus W]|nr:ABC-type transport system, permease component [Bdellovibrio bacteriovorus W]
MILKLALRELFRSWRFGLFFIFNLSLGLTGFVTLEAFNSALKQQIEINAKEILSADLGVTARRELSEDELKKIKSLLPSDSQETKIYEFFAMMSGKDQSRLIMLKGIDAAYPFYGMLQFESGATLTPQSESPLIGSHKVWIYPELKSQMGLEVGDKVQIGQLHLEVSEIVERDLTQSFRALALAPRVYVDRALLPESGLIQYGSTFSLMHAFKLPLSSEKDEELRAKILAEIKDPAVNVVTPQSAGEASSRQLGYLADYLGLVAMVSLFMSSLGAAYIYRLFITRRMKEIAILKTLGLQSIEAVGVYVLQASLLGFFALVPTVLFSSLLLPALSRLLSSFTPFELIPTITTSSVLIGLVMAVLGSFVVSLPFLWKIFGLKTAKLFSEEKFSEGFGKTQWWAFLPLVVLFYGLSVYQAHSFKIGTIFVLAMIAVSLGMLVLGWLVVKSSAWIKPRQWEYRFSFLSLSRRAGSSLSVFVALGLGALLINILPQLKNSLQAEFQLESASKVPSLFMFDIQDEQIEPLEKVLSEKNVKALRISPMVRARILKINDQDFERVTGNTGFKTREEEQDARTRNRGVNLSYGPLSSSERVVQGKGFSGVYVDDGKTLPEVSLESQFAKRMGLKIGDTLTFDIQGIEIQGKVVNLRKIKWTSFEPNFFVTIQEGVIEEAPKTFIAAIPALAEEDRRGLQNAVAKSLPNISIIDVARTVDDTLKTAEKMSWSLELMAGLTLLTGYIVLFSIVRSQIRMRRWELNMLKILGTTRGALTGFILSEFGYLAFSAAICGVGLSFFVSFALSVFVFQSGFSMSLWAPILSVVFITGLSLIISLLASLDIVNESALKILRGES